MSLRLKGEVRVRAELVWPKQAVDNSLTFICVGFPLPNSFYLDSLGQSSSVHWVPTVCWVFTTWQVIWNLDLHRDWTRLEPTHTWQWQLARKTTSWTSYPPTVKSWCFAILRGARCCCSLCGSRAEFATGTSAAWPRLPCLQYPNGLSRRKFWNLRGILVSSAVWAIMCISVLLWYHYDYMSYKRNSDHSVTFQAFNHSGQLITTLIMSGSGTNQRLSNGQISCSISQCQQIFCTKCGSHPWVICIKDATGSVLYTCTLCSYSSRDDCSTLDMPVGLACSAKG